VHGRGTCYRALLKTDGFHLAFLLYVPIVRRSRVVVRLYTFLPIPTCRAADDRICPSVIYIQQTLVISIYITCMYIQNVTALTGKRYNFDSVGNILPFSFRIISTRLYYNCIMLRFYFICQLKKHEFKIYIYIITI